VDKENREAIVKIAINRCCGGFSLSKAACMRYAEIKGFELYPFLDKWTMERHPDWKPDDDAILIHYSKIPYTGDNEKEACSDENYWSDRTIDRDDPALIQTIEELDLKASGRHAKLGIVEIPDDVQWTIEEYDGMEWVAEIHRTWN